MASADIPPLPRAPYPGLRAFLRSEAAVFFGREEHADELLDRLGQNRFLAVMGSSGCGKSSLVHAGLVPLLEEGFMADAGPHWRFAVMRPGADPFRRLTEALLDDRAFGPERSGTFETEVLEATLRRGPLGLAGAFQASVLPEGTNLLLVVDQYEEIFRFRRESNPDDADAFVRLLLAASRSERGRSHAAVYVVVTMRSDYLGECSVFEGLPEAMNECQFLTPRLTRDQCRGAVCGPARLFGGDIEPALYNRLLNELGADSDQLPVLQHALMRMWDLATGASGNATAGDERTTPVTLTLEHYDAVGGLAHALSKHADEALAELDQRRQRLARIMFCQLCGCGAELPDNRRPTSLREIAATAGVAWEDMRAVVDCFRRADRSFVMPPGDIPLAGDTVLDISHEALIRQWGTLRKWADEEAHSAATFKRLRDAAQRWPEEEPLLRDPALSIAIHWQRGAQPNDAWAARYGGNLERVLEYIDASRQERDAAQQRAEEGRQRELERARELAEAHRQRAEAEARTAARLQWLSIGLGVALAIAVIAGGWAIWKHIDAGRKQSEITSLSDRLRGLRTEQDQLGKDKKSLENDIRGLKEEKLRLVNEKEKLIAEFARTFREEKQKQGAWYEALDTISRAHGNVFPLDDGKYEAAFLESVESPDLALAKLIVFGEFVRVRLSRTRVSDSALLNLAEHPIKSLDLSHTDITDAGIANLARLEGMEELIINDTLITDAALVHLRRLQNLQSLDLSRNEISGDAVEELRRHVPAGCAITYVPDPLLQALAEREGDLERALELVDGTPVVSGDGEIVCLAFIGSPIGDSAVRRVTRLEKLRSVIMSRCAGVTDRALRYLADVPDLHELSLDFCGHVTAAGLAELRRAGNLKSLTLMDVAISDSSMESLAAIGGLEELKLGGLDSSITDLGLEPLGRLTHLQRLELHLVDITDNGLEHLKLLGNLKFLNLMACEEVRGEGLVHLKEMPALRSLKIWHSPAITDDSLKFLYDCEQLREIDLTGCKNITEAGVTGLEKALPEAVIEWDDMERRGPVPIEETHPTGRGDRPRR